MSAVASAPDAVVAEIRIATSSVTAATMTVAGDRARRPTDRRVMMSPSRRQPRRASGKRLVVASTRGNQRTAVQIDGKDLYLGVNANVYAEPKR